MDELGAILILIAAVWGSFGVMIRSYESINKRRDMILCGQNGDQTYTLKHRRLMFFSDMIPMQAGIVIFLGVFCCLLWHVPSFVGPGSNLDHIASIAKIASVVPLTGLAGYFIGGVQDIYATGLELRIIKRNDLKSEIKQLKTVKTQLERDILRLKEEQ